MNQHAKRWARLAESAWTSLVLRGLLWLAAFGALLWIGTGAARRLGAGAQASPIAEAQALPILPSAAASTFLAASPPPSARPPCHDVQYGKDAILPDGRVVLNRAGAADLAKLPGIGEKRALAILALRDRLGRFRSLRDLLRVRGIGLKMLRRLEPLVVVDPPADGAPQASTGEAPAG